MAAAFKVQGELVLENQQFVPAAREAKAALEGVSAAGRKVAETSAAVSAATTQASQAQAAAATSAKAQADGFARLAQQQAANLGKAQSQALMASVAQSNDQLKALYGTAARTQVSELGKVTAASREYEVATNVARVANDNSAQSIERQNRALVQQRIQLGYQLNDVFVQLASGQGVFRTAIQQGPQITQVFGGIGNTLRAIPLAAAGYAAGIGAVVGVTIAAITHLNQLNSQNKVNELSLQATGRAAQVTASQLDLLVQAEARRPGADRVETQKAALQLLGNNQITGEAVQRTLSLARDLARVTGTDLPTAAAALSAGLDGTVAGARKLDATFNALTPAELEQIRRYEEMGQKGAAVGVVLTALERNLAGANEKGVSPLEKGTAALRSSWNSLLDALAKTGAIHLAAGAINLLAAPVIGLANAVDLIKKATSDGGSSAGPDPKDIRDAQESLRLARERLAEAEANQKKNPGDYQFENAVNVARRRVADLQENVRQLETRAGTVTAKAVQDQLQGESTALKNEVKEALALLDKSITVAGQRKQLEGERAQIEKATRSGLLDPDQLARAQERITQINGQLKGLRTPAEELQRGLDLESVLAKLPPHLQAQERAYLETKRRVLELTGSVEEAEKAGSQARANVIQSQSTATQQQIQQLGAEAQAALGVARAYEISYAAALKASAFSAAQIAEQQGQIAPGTAATVAQDTLEKEAAAAVATAAEKNRAYAEELASLGRLTSAEAKGSEAAREAERVNRVAAFAIDLRAKAEATGSAAIIAAVEEQIRKYDELSKKHLELDRTRAANQLNAQFDPEFAANQRIADLERLKETGVLTERTVAEASRAYEQQRLEASRSATDGMVAGLRRYAEEANNTGRQVADMAYNASKSMEDALTQFVMTGKLNFSDLANSIIADLARIAIRKAITGPLSSAIGSIFSGGSGLFSGGDAGVGTGTGWTYHTGGIVGRDGTPRSGISPDIWDNAPRYHKGGLVAGERAIIAQDNEEVLTTDNPRHRWNIGRAMGGGESGDYGAPRFGLDIRVYTNGNGNVRAEQGAGADGMPSLDIFFDQAEQRMASKVSNTTGPLYKAFAGTFGVRQVARS